MKTTRRRRRSLVRAINPAHVPDGCWKGRDLVRANPRRPEAVYVPHEPKNSLSGKIAAQEQE